MKPSIGATGTVLSGVVCDNAVSPAAASAGMLSNWLWPLATTKALLNTSNLIASAARGAAACRSMPALEWPTRMTAPVLAPSTSTTAST